MRILFVSQYFPPEMGAPAARVSELTRRWARAGEEVIVLTGFAHHPVGVKAAGDRWRLTRRERADGVEVLRAYVFATPNRGVVKRMLSYASFMVSAVVVGLLRAPKPDVVVGTSPQLLAAFAAYLVARARGAPFVFEVRDLWPESILAVEAMGRNPVVAGLARMSRHLYRRAARIVTVGEGYRTEIHRRYGVPLDRMTSIPNGVEPELFVPGPRNNDVRLRHGWGDRFVIMYVGTLGMAHALHVVLDAAEAFRDDPGRLFVFVGEGAEKEKLRHVAAERKLTNVQFIDQQSKDRVPLYYAACDIGLVMLRDTPLFQSVLPSKIFEFLAMERPILLAVDGEARRIVERSGGGFYVPPEDPGALVAAIRKAGGGEVDLAEMGRSGRAFVLANFDRARQADDYLELLGGVVSGNGARRPLEPARSLPDANRRGGP